MRDWGLPAEVPLTPRAARRLARESVVQAFEPAARALNEDWGTHLDGKQVQRWAERPGDGTPEHPPRPLVTTYVATMGATEVFGKQLHVEAERRGLRQADTVLVLGDGGNWIDPLSEREHLHDQRIVDYYHAVEHLYEAARGRDTPEATALADRLKDALWDGQVEQVIATLQTHAQRLGPPEESDGAEHPRRVLANNVGHFQAYRWHMDYATYRRKGWPIGSGVTEAAVKQFNKRVKGTEQFWSLPGVEAVLFLRALWLSRDDRWRQYWNTRPAYAKAA